MVVTCKLSRGSSSFLLETELLCSFLLTFLLISLLNFLLALQDICRKSHIGVINFNLLMDISSLIMYNLN